MGAIQRVAGTLPIALDSHHSPARGFLGPRWVTFGRSRVRESRTLGSVGAKAEWLSYPTIPVLHEHAIFRRLGFRVLLDAKTPLFGRGTKFGSELSLDGLDGAIEDLLNRHVCQR